jgi:spore maturation protein CgeB
MRILFLGEIGAGQTSLMRMRALERLGHRVCGINTAAPWKQSSWSRRQLERRLQRGSIIRNINRAVLTKAREFRPDLVWAEKQEYLATDTLHSARKLGARLVHFTPDPYFYLSWKRTRLMDEAIRTFDVLIFCKRYEQADYEALGKPTIYMPLGYCDEVHRPLPAEDSKWAADVGFIGGWEPRRERVLHSVAAAGIDIKIRGAYWDFLKDGRWTFRRYVILRQLAGTEKFAISADTVLAQAHHGDEVYGDDYARAVTGARVGLGLLRRTWPDQHTTRTFEIPACGSMLLADRTNEHQNLFEEGKEADYFDSTEELLDKTIFYCHNELARQRIARRGQERCVQSKYAYIHRLNAALRIVAKVC